jgi:hypothetical protein
MDVQTTLVLAAFVPRASDGLDQAAFHLRGLRPARLGMPDGSQERHTCGEEGPRALASSRRAGPGALGSLALHQIGPITSSESTASRS